MQLLQRADLLRLPAPFVEISGSALDLDRFYHFTKAYRGLTIHRDRALEVAIEGQTQSGRMIFFCEATPSHAACFMVLLRSNECFQLDAIYPAHYVELADQMEPLWDRPNPKHQELNAIRHFSSTIGSEVAQFNRKTGAHLHFCKG